MDKNKISEPCFFRVSQNQMDVIQERFRQSGMKSFSAFLRQQVVHGIYLEFDKDELQSIRQAIQAIPESDSLSCNHSVQFCQPR